MTSPKQLTRRRRVFELRVIGLTIPQIQQKMTEEDFKVSERTIWQDLRSDDVKEFTDELMRRQLADITLSDNISVRLNYRDRLLDKLLPKKVESKGEIEAGIIIKGWDLGNAKGDSGKLQPPSTAGSVPQGQV